MSAEKRKGGGSKKKESADGVWVRTEGARLHVRITGPERGPAVVLLHGFPLNGSMWDAQVQALAKGWRVIVPDLRGHGRSDVGDGQFAIDFMADDLFAVLDAVAPRGDGDDRHAPVVACGLSMGGYVLLRAVEREPERFRALVLADTRSGGDTDWTRLKRLDAIRALKAQGLGRYAEMFCKTALGKTSHAERPDLIEAVKEMVTANDPRGLVGAQLAMAARTDTTDTLEELYMPTLVVAGDEDRITPADNAREMATRIARARLVIVAKAGHMTPMEAPIEFTRALVSFLEGLPDSG